MAKGKKTGGYHIEFVVKVTDDIEIWSDAYNYIIRYYSPDSNKEGRERSFKSSYFPNLRMCFEHIFEQLTKRRLGKNKTKSMEKMIETIQETQKEIKEVMKPFSELGRLDEDI